MANTITLIQKEIKNKTIRSFLYYVPYVTLSVMTFPAILEATNNTYAAAGGFLLAVLLAWFKRSLFQVSIAACAMVFVLEMFTVPCEYPVPGIRRHGSSHWRISSFF